MWQPLGLKRSQERKASWKGTKTALGSWSLECQASGRGKAALGPGLLLGLVWPWRLDFFHSEKERSHGSWMRHVPRGGGVRCRERGTVLCFCSKQQSCHDASSPPMCGSPNAFPRASAKEYYFRQQKFPFDRDGYRMAAQAGMCFYSVKLEHWAQGKAFIV